MKKFWMVVRLDRKDPHYSHETLDAALEEATRLCRRENTVFYILEAMKRIEPDSPPIRVTDL